MPPRASSRPRFTAVLVALTIVATLLVVLPANSTDAAGPALQALRDRVGSLVRPPSAEASVRDAWELARQAGSYRVTADSEQTLFPRAAAPAIGEQEQRVDTRLEGAIKLPDGADLSLRIEGMGADWPSMRLLHADGRSFTEVNGKLAEIEDPLSLAAPSSDFLGYLAGAQNVRRLEARTVGGERITRYGFEVSGEQLARHVRDRLAERLRGELPVGTALQPPPVFARTSGRGELWVSEDGLPIRQVLDLRLTEATPDYDVDLHLVVDFHGFGEVASLPHPVQGDDGSWSLPQSDPAPATTGGEARRRSPLAPITAALLAGLAVGALTVARRWQRWQRRVYAAVVLATIGSIVGGPVVRASMTAGFFREQRLRAEELPSFSEAHGWPQAPSPARAPLPDVMLDPDGRPLAAGNGDPVRSCSLENSTALDTDGDGLDDFAEGCLGTDPNSIDTDGDFLSDGLEARGVPELEDAHGMHSSDPMRPDSNEDGLPDGAEWPDPRGAAPAGGWDFDGDGVLNIWDDDNDGDGVVDGSDLSPYYVAPSYASTLSLDLTPPTDTVKTGDLYRYVTVQVQPSNPERLRYSVGPLDWPIDERGQIMNLSGATKNLRLQPYLQIEVDEVPSLAAQYGASWGAREGQAGYRMYLPLSPSAEGGRIQAFSGALGYTPDEANGTGGGPIEWRNTRLVWMAVAQLDTWKACQGDAVDRYHCRGFASRNEPIAVYQDQFRLTGLRVTSSGPSEIALIGTPRYTAAGTPNAPDDSYLANTFLGLLGTFLVTNTIGVGDVAETFRDPSAPITKTFGLPSTVERAVDFSGDAAHDPGPFRHSNTAWHTTSMTTTPAFLDELTVHERTVLGDWHTSASVLFAFTDRSGSRSLGDASVHQSFTADPGSGSLAVGVNLGLHTVHLSKGLLLQQYRLEANAWRRMPLEETVIALESAAPDLTDAQRLILRMLYAAFTTGQLALQESDGHDLVADLAVSSSELAHAYEEITGLMPPQANFGTYVAEISDAIGYRPGDSDPTIIDKTRDFFDKPAFQLGFSTLDVLIYLVLSHQGRPSGIEIDVADLATKLPAVIVKIFTLIRKSAMGIYCVYKIAAAAKAAETVPAVEAAVDEGMTIWGFLGAVGKILGVVALVVQIGIALWSMATAIIEHPHDPVVIWSAIALAVVQIVFLLVLFVMALIPGLDVIEAVLLALDALIFLVTFFAFGHPIEFLSEAQKWIAWAIVHADFLTTVISSGLGAMGTETFGAPGDTTGMIPWSRYVPSATFYATLCADGEGGSDDAGRSWLFGRWEADAVAADAYSQDMVHGDYLPDGFRPADTSSCTLDSTCRTCQNTLVSGFVMRSAQRNVRLTLETYAQYNIRIRWRIFFIPKDEDRGGTVPDAEEAAEEAVELYVDVLPETVGGLWNWWVDAPGIRNNDVDADGLPSWDEAYSGTDAGQCHCVGGSCRLVGSVPASPCTVIDQWDSDGDGLSDGFEAGNGALSGTGEISAKSPITEYLTLGASPSERDTDGDGLHDGLERRYGTSAADPDSDDDGLSDGEEIRRYDPIAGAWVGGWVVPIANDEGGTDDYWVSSNPNDADADADGIVDAQERAAELSPNAWDSGLPLLIAAAAPLAAGPSGQLGVYAAPGDPITATVTLISAGTHPITSTFSVCLPVGLKSDRIAEATEPVSHTIGTCDGGQGTLFAWPFSPATPMQEAAVLHATVAAIVDPSIEQSGEFGIRAWLKYGDKTIERTATVVVDAEDPTVAVIDPPDGAALRGESYVVGGVSGDETSWVREVGIDVGGQSWAITDTRRTSPWAVTWMLPAEDGPYDIQAQATDAVGHASDVAVSTVVVDNTAPALTLDITDGAYLPNITRGAGAITVTLTGTAHDPASGLERVQLSIDNRPWQTVATWSGAPTTAQDWSHPWELPGAAAQGEHSIAVRGTDRAGNVTDPPVVKHAVLDLLAPGSSLANRIAVVPSLSATQLLGHADETALEPPETRPEPLDGSLDGLAAATVRLEPASWSDGQGATATWIGDIDGDRRADLAVGMPSYDRPGVFTQTGQVAVVYGQAGGWAVPPDAETIAGQASTLVGAQNGRIGEHVAPAGDVNDDGLSDLLIGDPANNRVFVVFGRPGPLGRDLVLDAPTGHWSVISAPPDGQIGDWIAAAGDVNADGYDDLLIGATGGTGHVYLLLGQSARPGMTVDLASEAAAVLPLDPAGAVATGVGNVNGDPHGYDDFVVADPGNSFGAAGPALYLFTGSAAFQPPVPGAQREPRALDPAVDAAATFAGPDALRVGVAWLGDVDGDGVDDFAYTSGGEPHLVYGRAEPEQGSPPPWQQLVLDNLGGSAVYLTAAGDVDRDGLNELIAGTAGETAVGVLGRQLAGKPSAPPEPGFSLTDVVAVAAAPYAAGADANCDGSSDLLLVPGAGAGGAQATAGPDFGPLPRVAPGSLPVARIGGAQHTSVAQPAGSQGTLAERVARLAPWLPARRQDMRTTANGQTAYVSPRYCPTCDNDGHAWGTSGFASIGAAIDSGASNVRVLPGTYPEALRLTDGLQLIGAGADLTVVQPPAGTTAIAVADGLRDVLVARLTLAGDRRMDGVSARNGAQAITLRRVIVRETRRAVVVDGSSAVSLINDTLVDNATGLAAATCAAADVRNTVFAFNTTAGAAYDSCPAGTALNRYNLYWHPAGVPDVTVSGTSVDASALGQGQVLADPLFLDATHDDFRMRPESPAIGAGEPGDAPPPGGAARTDIGYVEMGQAAISVRPPGECETCYCETCLNDGLEWQVDAFDRIQDAVDAAARLIEGLGCTDAGPARACPVPVTVGVGPGTYVEQVTVPSGVRLLGSGATGADRSWIQGPGSGSVISVTRAARTEISGFKITGFGTGTEDAGIKVVGPSNHITVTGNLVIGSWTPSSSAVNQSGVAFGDGTSGAVWNNTVVGTFAGIASRGHARAEVRSTLLVDNNYGLHAIQVGPTYGRITSDYNLLSNATRNYMPEGGTDPAILVLGHDLTPGRDGVLLQQPEVSSPCEYCPQPASPAIRAGDPFLPNRTDGAAHTDIGYRQLVAAPLAMLFGQEGVSCATGNAGVSEIEVGLSHVPDAGTPVADTWPTSWQTATLSSTLETGTYWGLPVTPSGGDGLYRLYARSTDAAGNSDERFLTTFLADGEAPKATWISPMDDVTTDAAAIEVIAGARDYVPTGDGLRFSVERVYFEVTGPAGDTIVDADWLDPAWTPDPSGTRARAARAAIPLATGSYEVTAVVEDEAGNVGRSASRSFSVVGGDDIATVTWPPAGSAVTSASLTVAGFARFGGSNHEVALYVDDVAAGTATVAEPAAPFSAWSGNVTLTGEGSHTLKAVAAGNVAAGDPVTLTLDTEPPTLGIIAPAAGTVISGTVTLSGTAGDGGSGLTSVAASFDGGSEWRTTVLTPIAEGQAEWSLTWQPPPDSDFVSVPLRVRARDRAGAEEIVDHVLVLDNVPPAAPGGLGFSAPEEQYVGIFQALEVSWDRAPHDGSGEARTLVRFDRVDKGHDTAPPPVDPGWSPAMGSPLVGYARVPEGNTSYSRTLDDYGDWYVQLAVEDGAGNIAVDTYGPWHAGTKTGGSSAAPDEPGMRLSAQESWHQPIIVDGFLDFGGEEWLDATELMDMDVRSGRDQALYAAWDTRSLYLGWLGAAWGPDGTLFAYVDVAPGGSREPLADGPDLPFEADHAVAIGAEGGALWIFNDDWQRLQTEPGDFAFASGRNTGTEIRLPLGAERVAGPVSLVAFATDDTGETWSLFPTTNPLSGPWTEAYAWPGLGRDVVPNEGQPRHHPVIVHMSSDQSGLAAWGAGTRIDYVLDIENSGARALAPTTLELNASRGLLFGSATGAACASCPPGGDSWRLDVDPIAAKAGHRITVAARIGPDLQGVATVTATARLSTAGPGGGTIDQASSSHAVDGVRPTVDLVAPAHRTLRPGRRSVRGVARDPVGTDLARVEVRVAGAPGWTTAHGTQHWSAVIDVPPSGAFALEVRATDAAGLTSEIGRYDLTVDTVPPTVDFGRPPYSDGTRLFAEGTAVDPFPDNGPIRRIELQVDDGRWLRASSAPVHGPDGIATWRSVEALPRAGAGRVRARAIDAAGNVGPPSAWQSVTVDVPATADISVTQSASPSPVEAGGSFALLVTITNNGPAEATGVRLIETLPAHATLEAVPPACSRSAGMLECDLGTLASAEAKIVELHLTADANPLVRRVLVVAAARSDVPDGRAHNDSVTTAIPIGTRWLLLPAVVKRGELAPIVR